MSSTVVLKAAGLYTSPNELSLPEGSLSEAKNIVIRRDGIIEQRRGFKLYGNSGGTTLDRAKQLAVYRGRIIRHISDTLQYDSDGNGKFQSFLGSFNQADSILRMKFIESNGNLYFTSSNGIQKISSKTADNLSSSTVVKAGATKAIDISSKVIYNENHQTDFLPQDSAVAYRVLWGYKDSNNNTILGSPSQREVVYFNQLDFMLRDYMRFLSTLDSFSNATLTTARINDKNYVSLLGLNSGSSAAELRANLITLATKIDTDILIANSGTAPLTITAVPTITTGICTITFSAGTATDYFQAGSKIFLDGFTTTTGTINGKQTIVTVGASSITFNTTATGPVTMTSPTINSGEFRSIVEPPTVQVPPVHIDNMDIQAYMVSIINALRIVPPTIIDANDQLILDTVDVTTTSTIKLTVSIPQDIDSRYFYQIYRSAIFSAADTVSISDVSPNDELQLVYEAYPTNTEISNGSLSVIDVTPDNFRGANLYTNNSTGEGILQANEIPPFAKDVNRYRNVVFYANTRTKHKSLLNLIGVQSMIADYNLGIIPSITIATSSNVNTYKFVTGLQEINQITTVADVSNSLNGKYFIMSSTSGNLYCFYFETTTATAPSLGTNYKYVKVKIATNETAPNVANALKDKISVLLSDFKVSVLSNVVTVTNVDYGTVSDLYDVDTGFILSVTQQGRGENIAQKQVLLSTNVSPSIAVDETARSLIRVINGNTSESVYGFYLSGSFDVPGKMLIESRNLQTTDQFFIVSNNKNTGDSFNPTISPDLQISTIGLGANPLITTSSNHNLANRDFVVIGNTNSTPSVDGVYEITYVSPTSFTITPTNPVTVAGTLGCVISSTNVVTSENETKPNRVYYSKLYQPEAVPQANYFDVGAEDKQILRIFPLRDSLFVFKEDGLYRISGDSAPFQLNLFDSSFIITAPDSVTVSNNVIFGWTTQGIQSLTEGGAQVISRPIDNQILKIGSNNYTNFKTTTFGVGYESDNSYLVWTVTNSDDTVATKAFRYTTLTQTWTTYDKTNTCGIVSNADDKLYLGAGDTNYIEQERKSFDRTDFADRELSSTLNNGFLISPNIVKLASITGYSVGDVIIQDQTLTCFEFNTLLEKLDNDPSVAQNNFLSTLSLSAGENPRTKLLSLADKLDLDANIVAANFKSTIDNYSGTITSNTAVNSTVITSANHNLISGRKILISGSNCSPSINGEYIVTVINSNTFSINVSVQNPGTAGFWQTVGLDSEDLKVCYNKICDILNADTGVSFNNYRHIDNNTVQEAIITNINVITKQVTLNIALQFIVGNITIFKAIPTSLTYSPVSFGDPLNLKHLRESTVMLQNRNITEATLSFGTDLLPEFIQIPFALDGNGTFGSSPFGTGLFGGTASSAPFRTYIPRQCQRCRFIVTKFQHNVAREDYKLLGISLTGEVGQSTRAYR